MNASLDVHKEKTQLRYQKISDFSFYFFLEVCSFLSCVSASLGTFNLGKIKPFGMMCKASSIFVAQLCFKRE